MTKLDNPMSFKHLGGCAGHACVSSSPSEIPYGGFSPVRLKTGCQRQPSPYRAYMPPPAHVTPVPALAARCRRRGGRPEHSGPEALGSPAGYRVPSGLGLLWPHPSLSVSPADFACLAYTAGLCLAAESERVPNLICVSFFPCRLPYPGGPDGGVTVRSPSVIAFAQFRKARRPPRSAPVGSRAGFFSGLQSSLYATARKVARPSPTRAFTFELSSQESPP